MIFTVDFKVESTQSAFLDLFNDIVVDVPAEDMYYLLQTFASMALAREMDDIEFIGRVTTDLFMVCSYSFFNEKNVNFPHSHYFFNILNMLNISNDIQIGFINALTRDTCYKIVRDLLVNITSKHTVLISDLLLLLRENFKKVN